MLSCGSSATGVSNARAKRAWRSGCRRARTVARGTYGEDGIRSYGLELQHSADGIEDRTRDDLDRGWRRDRGMRVAERPASSPGYAVGTLHPCGEAARLPNAGARVNAAARPVPNRDR